MWPRGASEAQSCQKLGLILKSAQGLWVSLYGRSSAIPDSSSIKDVLYSTRALWHSLVNTVMRRTKKKHRMDLKKKNKPT